MTLSINIFFQCWRDGKKIRDIVDGWDGVITEKDVTDKFKFILSKYFEIMKEE